VGDDARLWRLLLMADVRDDHGTVRADPHLRPVGLTDPDALDETEGRGALMEQGNSTTPRPCSLEADGDV
jgi:hypothetical protein